MYAGANAPAVADPRGTKLAWSDATPEALAAQPEDGRPAVRRRAVHELARRGAEVDSAARELRSESSDAAARARPVWTLARIDTAEAKAAIRAALLDTDETVRQAAIHTSSVARDRAAVPELIKIVRRGTPQNRRAAAEAWPVGRSYGRARAVGGGRRRAGSHARTFRDVRAD